MIPKLVPNLRDEQLNDLGVTTIGDRAALRAACYCHPLFIECKYYLWLGIYHKFSQLCSAFWNAAGTVV